MMALLLAVAIQAPDPIAVEVKFKELLARVEKVGLSVPELPDGAAELEKLRLSVRLPKDLLDRHDVVRSQATVLKTLHAHLLKNKDGQLEMPLPTGKPVSARIVEVLKRSVKVSRPEGTPEFSFSELDPEWVLSVGRAGFADTEAAFLGGLWLAKAARWDAAFLAFGETATDHPLAAEARKRGIEAAAATFDALTRARRWTEALSRLGALEKLAPNEARLATVRAKILDAIVEHGKDLSRKKSKGPMQEIIDLIAKHFPDGASRIEDIREAGRWVKITDPKLFGIGAAKGPPWFLEPKEGDSARTAWLVESTESYEGIAAVVRIPKGEKTHGGLIWNDRTNIVSINARRESVGVYEGNKGELLPNVFARNVRLESRHHLSVRLRDGQFVVQYNGEEIHRTAGTADGFKVAGLNAFEGKAWFDEVWLLKRE